MWRWAASIYMWSWCICCNDIRVTVIQVTGIFKKSRAFPHAVTPAPINSCEDCKYLSLLHLLRAINTWCRLCTWMLTRTCCLNVWLCWANSLLCGSPISDILAWFELSFYLFHFLWRFPFCSLPLLWQSEVGDIVFFVVLFLYVYFCFLAPQRICNIAGKYDKDAVSRRRSGYDKKTSSADNHFLERPWYQVLLSIPYLSTHASPGQCIWWSFLVLVIDYWYVLQLFLY